MRTGLIFFVVVNKALIQSELFGRREVKQTCSSEPRRKLLSPPIRRRLSSPYMRRNRSRTKLINRTESHVERCSEDEVIRLNSNKTQFLVVIIERIEISDRLAFSQNRPFSIYQVLFTFSIFVVCELQ